MPALPNYEILVSPILLQQLKRNVWQERTIPAYVDIGHGPQETRIKYRGAHTRVLEKKSYFMKMHGEEWHLNADAVDPSRIRSKWSFDWFSALSVLAPRATHVTLSINGESQGVYTLLESVDRHFFARRRLGQGDLFYAINNAADFRLTSGLKRTRMKKRLTEGYEWKERQNEHGRHHLAQFIWKLNTIPQRHLHPWLHKTVEVRHYLRWLAGAVLTGNADGFLHNYALYRHPQTLKWWIIPWDYDGTWGRDCYGNRMGATEIPLAGYNRLTERILSVGAYRHYYLRLMVKLLKDHFVPNRLMREALSLMDGVRRAVYATANRFEAIERFEAEKGVFKDYITGRRQYLLRAIEQSSSGHNLLPIRPKTGSHPKGQRLPLTALLSPSEPPFT